MPTDLETLDEEQQPDESPVMRDLRQQAKQAKSEKDRADGLEQKLALSEAGLNSLNEDQKNALIGAHKDAPWDKQSVLDTANRLGWAPPSEGEPPDQPQISADELAAHQRVADAASGESVFPADLKSEAALTAAILAVPDGPGSTEQIKELLRNAGRLAEGD